MTWIVGIDEAGYGPNLGPLVMTSVACRLPDHLAGADLWQLLADAVRRQADPDDGRAVVDDSKLVYTAARGLAGLETSVLSLLRTAAAGAGPALADCLACLSPAGLAELSEERWFVGDSLLPVAAGTEAIAHAAGRLQRASRSRQLDWGLIRAVIICPARFNQLLEQWETKSAVLAEALAELIAANHQPHAGDEPVAFHIDKHGGRNHYAAMLTHALPAGTVTVVEEGMRRSDYRVRGLGQPLSLTFQPRADTAHLCVALASMVSKYLRELLMGEFNRFWQRHLPGLQPTAGYPGDAERFWTAIQPVAQRLQIPPRVLWRRR
jgi:ribonuclease HII